MRCEVWLADAAAAAERCAGVADFVYLDPPYASGASYRSGGEVVFEDRDPMDEYLVKLRELIQAAHRVLSPTGVLCLHLDWHAVHAAKLAGDEIFGRANFLNEIIWRYGKMGNSPRRFGSSHDTILVWTKGPGWYYAPVYVEPSEYRTRYKRYLTGNQVLWGTVAGLSDKLLARRATALRAELGRELRDDDVLFDFDIERKAMTDVFADIPIIRGNSAERVGFDTQKPVHLVRRLMDAWCPPGGLAADLCVGSGTTAVAAAESGRPFVVGDRSPIAVATCLDRLSGAGPVELRLADPASLPDR